MSVGYLADAFDLINVRDLDLISQARERCSRLILGVFTDQFAEWSSGRPPVMPLAERMALVGHVDGVDDVMAHEGHLDDLELALGHVPARDRLLFAAVDSPTIPTFEVTWLTPRRHSLSLLLRGALAPWDTSSSLVEVVA